MLTATFRSPARPIAQYVKDRKALKFPQRIEGKDLGPMVGKPGCVAPTIWGFNWKITANLLHLREIGVYHTATAA